MIGFMEVQALKSFFGLTDAEIAVLEARLPDVIYLIKLVRDHQTVLNRVITELAPLLQKMLEKEQVLVP